MRECNRAGRHVRRRLCHCARLAPHHDVRPIHLGARPSPQRLPLTRSPHCRALRVAQVHVPFSSILLGLDELLQYPEAKANQDLHSDICIMQNAAEAMQR